MTLLARTRPLAGEVDLLAAAGPDGVLFERAGSGLAGRGEAMRVRVADAAGALAAIERDDTVGRAGCGPVALGALPFDRSRWDDAELVVPSVVWGRDEDGNAWVTTIGPAGSEVHEAPDVAELPAAPAVGGPSAFTVTPGRPPEEWCDLVALATAAMAAGELEKVVLAREITVEADRPFVVADLLTRLRAAYPGCFVAHVDGFVAASPELLVGRRGDAVRAHPMAGTAPRGGDPEGDARLAAALLASPTYRHEHQVTIDVVHDTLLDFCSYVDDEGEPSVVAIANVQHLATWVEGRLSHPPASVVELARALHPTPAVCGRPREAAEAFIAAHEGFDRRRYAGAYGWVDADGNGDWAVGIRCAELDGRSARAYAGNGIVADSDPATELRETRAKLQAILSALLRP
jgi:menaquinone-specific isochorismate synthase